MARVREQSEREDRILFEIVVDAYGETERAMSWYYYLQDAMQMPFEAICRSQRATSPLEIGSKVKVVSMAAEDSCMSEVLVLVKYGKSQLAVPLAQVECKAPDEGTRQAVEDWHYWVARGYEY
jgi:Calcium binding